jgi:copper chaperone CopZ
MSRMAETVLYTVPAMHCGNCERAIKEELAAVDGVIAVTVDLETNLVTVTGDDLDDGILRAAIEEAGYQAA